MPKTNIDELVEKLETGVSRLTAHVLLIPMQISHGGLSSKEAMKKMETFQGDFTEEIKQALLTVQEQTLKEIEIDMKEKMKGWEGTGKAMLEDYFNKTT